MIHGEEFLELISTKPLVSLFSEREASAVCCIIAGVSYFVSTYSVKQCVSSVWGGVNGEKYLCKREVFHFQGRIKVL